MEAESDVQRNFENNLAGMIDEAPRSRIISLIAARSLAETLSVSELHWNYELPALVDEAPPTGIVDQSDVCNPFSPMLTAAGSEKLLTMSNFASKTIWPLMSMKKCLAVACRQRQTFTKTRNAVELRHNDDLSGAIDKA